VIRIALEICGAPYTCALVDRTQNAQRSAAYLEMNPLGMIPALETPDGPLFETGAIVLWLADRHGGLLPAPDDPDRGAALKWLFFLSNSLHAQLRQMFYPQTFVAPAHSGALQAGLAPRIYSDFARIDALAGHGNCFGTGRCRALDVYAACLWRFARLYPQTGTAIAPEQASALPHLHSLCRTLESLPAVHTAQAAEGLGAAPFTAPGYANPPIGSAT